MLECSLFHFINLPLVNERVQKCLSNIITIKTADQLCFNKNFVLGTNESQIPGELFEVLIVLKLLAT